MKSLFAIALVTLSLSFCNFLSNKNNSNNSNNSNSSKPATVKEKFMGRWEVAPETTSDFTGGPITFMDDGTYTAQKTTNPNSSTFKGGYTLKDDKLYLDGELKEFTAEGFSLDGDNRMKLKHKDKTLYFVKK
jgi:hypothetical protein